VPLSYFDTDWRLVGTGGRQSQRLTGKGRPRGKKKIQKKTSHTSPHMQASGIKISQRQRRVLQTCPVLRCSSASPLLTAEPRKERAVGRSAAVVVPGHAFAPCQLPSTPRVQQASYTEMSIVLTPTKAPEMKSLVPARSLSASSTSCSVRYCLHSARRPGTATPLEVKSRAILGCRQELQCSRSCSAEHVDASPSGLWGRRPARNHRPELLAEYLRAR